MFALELLDEVVDKTIVEIFTTQVSITSSWLDLKDTILNGENGNIESTTAQIEDKDIALGSDLLVQTVCNSGGGGLVDDTENVQAWDGTGVLGGLTLK